MQIDRTSPLPFYAQLKQILLADIAERGLVPGDRFRSDHEIADRFGVSRSVVRQALAELEADGVIERSKGRGTFIARQKVGEGLARSLRGLHEDAALRGSQVTSTVLRQEVVPAPPAVGSRLGLAQDASVVVIERLRRLDGDPWVHTTTWLPSALVPGLETFVAYHRGHRSRFDVAIGGSQPGVVMVPHATGEASG